MKLHAFATGPELLARAGDFLRQRESEHALQLGLAERLAERPAEPARWPYLATVEAGDDVVAVAVRTPPHNVVLSHIAPAHRAGALACLVDDLRARDTTLPGAFGPREEAEDFAARWAHAAGVPSRLAMAMREYALERVDPPAGVAGAMRAASSADLELVYAWSQAFIDETGLPEADRIFASRERTAERIAKGSYWLWCVEGTSCAMAGASGTPRVARIGAVYTPPAQRKRGYASALTAALSQRLLDAGASRVCLSTDLANPTSNRIYQAIGFRPLSDRAMFAFDAAP